MALPIPGFVGLDFDPEYVPNPYFAHVEFWIGDPTDPNAILLTSHDQRTPFNFSLVSFRHTRETADLANHFEIVLYDPGFTEIETVLHAAPNQVSFKYYYVIPSSAGGYPAQSKTSPIYSAVIASWDPAMTMAGTVLTIQGVGWLNRGNIAKRYIWSKALSDQDVQDSLTRLRNSEEYAFYNPSFNIDSSQFVELEGQDDIPTSTAQPTASTSRDAGASVIPASSSGGSEYTIPSNEESLAALDALENSEFSPFPSDVGDPSDPIINDPQSSNQKDILRGIGNDIGIKDDRDGLRISDIAILVATGALDSEEVRQIQGKPWIPDVEPTKPVLEFNGLKTTAPKNKIWCQSGMTDIEFLHSIVPEAVSLTDQSGYRVWTTDELSLSGEKRTVLHFKPPDLSQSATRVFTYMYGDPSSEVLSFSASVKLELLAASEGGESQYTYQDALSGNIEAVTANKQTDILSNAYAYVEGVAASLNSLGSVFGLEIDTSGLQKSLKDLSSTIVNSHYVLEEASSLNRAFYHWYQNYLQFLSADMMVMGDPSLIPMQIIEVWVMLPPSTNLPQQSIRGRETEGIHPVSGKFLVQRVIDEISGGTFTTRLELSRTEMLPGTTGGPYNQTAGSPAGNASAGQPPAMESRPKTKQPPRTRINTASSNASVRVPASSKNRAEPETTAQYSMPIDSECVTSPFSLSRTIGGRTRPHKGCDLRAAIGTSVSSPVSGKVTRVSYDAGGYGNWIEVEESSTGNRFRFAHLDSTSVKQGQRVAEGTYLGDSGNTGGSTGPHLHLEVLVNGVQEDPGKYFPLPPRCGAGASDA